MFFKFNIKSVAHIIICFLCHQLIGISMDNNDTKASRNPENKVAVNAMFPGTSMPDQDWWRVLWPNPQGVVVSLGVKPHMVSIDLCCGDGYFTVPLAQNSLRTYGLELDGALIDKAREEIEKQNVKNCFLIQGDAMDIADLIPEKVDFILLANTFHGIPDKEKIVKSMASALKPEGKIAIVNWHKKEREETTVLGLPRGPKSEVRMPPQEVESVLNPLGLFLEKTIELQPYHYGIIFNSVHSK